jgi:hypothetical protein
MHDTFLPGFTQDEPKAYDSFPIQELQSRPVIRKTIVTAFLHLQEILSGIHSPRPETGGTFANILSQTTILSMFPQVPTCRNRPLAGIRLGDGFPADISA